MITHWKRAGVFTPKGKPTFKHLVNVVSKILYPPLVAQLCAHHLLRDAVLSHVDHWVSILRLYGA